jgi:acetyl-CoA C-acetyltransferase
MGAAAGGIPLDVPATKLELRRRGGGTGAAALCGGGQGDALILRVPPRDDHPGR